MNLTGWVALRARPPWISPYPAGGCFNPTPPSSGTHPVVAIGPRRLKLGAALGKIAAIWCSPHRGWVSVRATLSEESPLVDDREEPINDHQLHELLYQALETELGGVEIYAAAIQCVKNDDLREEWEKYHQQTKRHVELVEGALKASVSTRRSRLRPRAVRQIGVSLVEAMQMALDEGPPEAAQLLAAECVTLAETKDHRNWELIGEVVKHPKARRVRSSTRLSPK